MYPESLVKECQKRIEKYPCEGFVYGQGPEKAEIMLVGEAPGKRKSITESLSAAERENNYPSF